MAGPNGDLKTNQKINRSFRVGVKQLRLLSKLVKRRGHSKSHWVRLGIDLILKEEEMVDKNGIEIRNYQDN